MTLFYWIFLSVCLYSGLTLVSGGTGNGSTRGWLIGVGISLRLIFIIKINYDIGSVTLFIKMYNARVHGRPCGGSICPVMGRLSELT